MQGGPGGPDEDSSGLLPTRRERQRVYAAALVVSVVVGFGSYLIKADLPQSILLGIATMLAFLAIESNSMALSLTRAVKITNSRLDRVISRLETRDRFVESWEHLHDSGPAGVELAGTIERIQSSLKELPAPLLGLANEALGEPATALTRQELVHTGRDPALGTNLVRWFRHTAFATSIHPMEFWLTPWGQNYHQAMCDRTRELSRAGSVSFRRVFIVRAESARDLIAGPYYELIREQINAGIDVRVCLESDLSPELRVDFGIWDRSLEAFLIPDEGHRITKVYYRYSSDMVRAAEQRATLIWDRSVPFDSWIRVVRAGASE